MNYRSLIEEIVASYSKHGWTLRRVLLRSATQRELGATGSEFGDGVSVNEAEVDALWFSRQSQPDSEAWELRRLTGSPFALVAVISSDAESSEVDETLAQVEDEMSSKTTA